MVQKSRSKKRGIPKGVQRHRMKPQKVNQGVSCLEKALNTFGAESRHVSHAAKLCLRYTSKMCTLFSLIPLQALTGCKFEHAPFPKQLFHYILIAFYGSFTVYKLGVTIHLMTSAEMNAVAVMCAGSFSLSFFSMCGSLGSSWSSSQMRDLLNSMDYTVENMRRSTDEHIQVFSSIPTCLKLIAITWLSHCAALNAAAFSLVFDGLPISIIFMAQTMSLIPENVLPIIFWQVAFYPLEVLTLYPPMCSTAFNGHTYVTGLRLLGLYAEQLRYDQLLPNWLCRSNLSNIMLPRENGDD